jgi:hypothetical protein
MNWRKILGFERPQVTLAAQPNEKKRVGHRLKRQRLYKAEMQMDVFDGAVAATEDPEKPDRSQLLGMYVQALDDAHLHSQIQTRKLKTMGEAFAIFNKAGKVDEEKTKLIKAPWVNKLNGYILDSEYWGHSLVEFGQLDEDNEISDVFLIPREHVRPETGEILIEPGDDKGLPYRGGKLSPMLMEFGEFDNLGLLKKAIPYVIWKRYAQVDWSRHSEKFGMPALFIKTRETRQEELDKKEQMLSDFGSNLYGILDYEDEIEKLDLNSTDSHKIYNQNIERCNAEMSKLINGVVVGEASQGGSRAKEEVGERMQNEYSVADMRRLVYVWNWEVIPFLIELGYPFQEDDEFDFLANRADDEEEKDDAGGEEGSEKKQLTASKVAGLYSMNCCPNH